MLVPGILPVGPVAFDSTAASAARGNGAAKVERSLELNGGESVDAEGGGGADGRDGGGDQFRPPPRGTDLPRQVKSMGEMWPSEEMHGLPPAARGWRVSGSSPTRSPTHSPVPLRSLTVSSVLHPPRQVEALLALTHGLKQVLEAARTTS